MGGHVDERMKTHHIVGGAGWVVATGVSCACRAEFFSEQRP